MRSLIITQNTTIDGAVEMLGDWFEPQGQADMADLTEEMLRQDAAADAFLAGRRTFEDLRGYWRDLADDRTGVSDYLNGVQKHVVSSTIEDPQWDRTTVLRGDPIDEVRALKQADGLDIVLTGSISLAHTLIPSGLVDEYRLFVYPAVQQEGRRLFPAGSPPPSLDLVESKAFRSGIVLNRYAVRR